MEPTRLSTSKRKKQVYLLQYSDESNSSQISEGFETELALSLSGIPKSTVAPQTRECREHLEAMQMVLRLNEQMLFVYMPLLTVLIDLVPLFLPEVTMTLLKKISLPWTKWIIPVSDIWWSWRLSIKYKYKSNFIVEMNEKGNSACG